MKKPIVREPGEGERLEAGPTAAVVKVAGAAAGDRLGVVEMRIEAGWPGPPPHSHGEIDHVWYVLEGIAVLQVGTERRPYRVGSCAYVPAGVVHGFGTAGKDAVLLQVDTPRSMDGYFRDLARAFPPGTAVDPSIVAGIMSRHDTHPVPV